MLFQAEETEKLQSDFQKSQFEFLKTLTATLKKGAKPGLKHS
jgi:hypothetical protein